MKIICAAMISFLFLLVSGCTRQKANSSDDVQAIKKTLEEYSKAINARDANAATEMMTEKTYFAEMNLPASNGKDAVQKLLMGMFDQYSQSDIKFDAPTQDVRTDGSLGTARGTWSFEAKDKAETTAAVNESGNWSLICHRENNGAWKWDSVVINSDQPLPGATANAGDEKALTRIEQDSNAAMTRAEKALGRLKPDYKLESVSIKDIKPYVFGDFALVKITGEMKGKYNGNDQDGMLEGVDFFVRRNGQWQVAYSQNTATVP